MKNLKGVSWLVSQKNVLSLLTDGRMYSTSWPGCFPEVGCKAVSHNAAVPRLTNRRLVTFVLAFVLHIYKPTFELVLKSCPVSVRVPRSSTR